MIKHVLHAMYKTFEAVPVKGTQSHALSIDAHCSLSVPERMYARRCKNFRMVHAQFVKQSELCLVGVLACSCTDGRPAVIMSSTRAYSLVASSVKVSHSEI